MTHTARLMGKRVAILLAVALVLSSFVGFLGTGVAGAEGEQVSRIDGNNRYDTAAKAALAKYDTADAVILTDGEILVDGLAGSVLAGALDAPILLSNRNSKSLPAETKRAIEQLDPDIVYILGGTDAVPASVEDELKAEGYRVERLAGEERQDRFDTAVAIVNKAKELGASLEKAYVIGSEKSVVDALVAGPAAFLNGSAVIPVKDDAAVLAFVVKALNDLGVREVVVVGGTDVVSEAVEVALKDEFGDEQVRRIGGVGRVETSVDFAREEFASPAGFMLVRGEGDKQDAGVDAVAGLVYGYPILLLIDADELPQGVAELLEEHAGLPVVLMGNTEAIGEGVEEKVKEAVGEKELRVVSVSAITTTVDTSGDSLKFAINGQTEAPDQETLEALKKAGYTFEFLANKAVFAAGKSTSEDGALDTLRPGTTFIYQVKVYLDGELVAESERQEVTVIDKAATVTAISAIELYVKQENIEIKVESGKLAEGDQAYVKVLGRTAAMAEDAKDADITALVDLSTDIPAIATVSPNGLIKLPGAKGNVTITARAGELEHSITVNAGNPKRVPSAENSTVAPASLKLATGQDAVIEVALKDQYGDTFVQDVENQVVIEDDESLLTGDKSVGVVDEDTGDPRVKISLTAGQKAGEGTILVKYSNVELAKVDLTVKAPGDIAEYRLETEDGQDPVIDLKGEQTVNLYLKAYDEDGLFVEQVKNLEGYAVKSNNATVADASIDIVDDQQKVVVTGKKPGTARITVYREEDAFEDPVAETVVTVINSTPTVVGVTFAEVGTITEAGSIPVSEIIEKIEARNPEGQAVETMIDVDDSNGNDDSNSNFVIKESGSEVVIGSVKVMTIPQGRSTVSAEASKDDDDNPVLSVKGAGKATINVAVLDADNKFVGQTEIAVDIPDSREPGIDVGSSKYVYENGQATLTVVAWDDFQLKELEIDHNYGNYGANDLGLPEFSVYASEEDPFGGQGDKFAAYGVKVTYKEEIRDGQVIGTWTITFDEEDLNKKLPENSNAADILSNLQFYLVVYDADGNASGDMDGNYVTIPKNN